MIDGRPIYDCFTFHDELDLLEIRLHTLADLVDQFVLVEARQTMVSCQPKRLHYQENCGRFRGFAHRIRHVVVPDLPPPSPADPWAQEAFQRDAILTGLLDVPDTALMLVADVDEIPAPEALCRAVIRHAQDPCALQMEVYWYYLNAHRIGRPQRCAVLCSVGEARHRTPNLVRNDQACGKDSGRIPVVVKGGWHFTMQGGVDRILAKLPTSGHTEINAPGVRAWVPSAYAALEDLEGNPLVVEGIGPGYPDWLVRNQDRYEHLIYHGSGREKGTGAPNLAESEGAILSRC